MINTHKKTKKGNILIAIRYLLAYYVYYYVFHILLTKRYDVGGVGGDY